jgi:hypothetical protein
VNLSRINDKIRNFLLTEYFPGFINNDTGPVNMVRHLYMLHLCLPGITKENGSMFVKLVLYPIMNYTPPPPPDRNTRNCRYRPGVSGRSAPLRGGLFSTYSIEAFPKLKFWENSLKIRSFARLKARKTARAAAQATAQACPKTLRISAQSISFGTDSIFSHVFHPVSKEAVPESGLNRIIRGRFFLLSHHAKEFI